MIKENSFKEDLLKEIEFKELREKAKEIFWKKLNSIKELEKPKKVGNTVMIKEADLIIFQINEMDLLEKLNLNLLDMPYAIGLGDSKNREIKRTHLRIVVEIINEIKKNIWVSMSGLLWLDENEKINLGLDKQEFNKLFEGISIKLEPFEEMLRYYEVKKLWLCDEKENKELFEKMQINKPVAK